MNISTFKLAFNDLWYTIDLSTTLVQQNTITDTILNAEAPRLWISHLRDTEELLKRITEGKLLKLLYEFRRQAIMTFKLENIEWTDIENMVIDSLVCIGGDDELDIDKKKVTEMFSKYNWLSLLYVLHYGNTSGLIDQYRDDKRERENKK